MGSWGGGGGGGGGGLGVWELMFFTHKIGEAKL